MAHYRTRPSNRTKEQRFCLDSRGKLYGGIEKKRAPGPIRRSARLRDRRGGLDKGCEESYPSPSPSSSPAGHSPEHQTAAPQAKDRKRKRQQELEVELRSAPASKKSRASPTGPKEGTPGVEGGRRAIKEINPIEYWTKEGSWPKEYFEPDDQTKDYLNRDLDEESWLRKYWIPEMEYQHLLARKKSSSSLRRIQPQPGSSASATPTPSDQRPREEKSNGYNDARYDTLLATKGSFMDEDEEGIKHESRCICQTLLEKDQGVPQDSLFHDNRFKAVCRKVRNRNEAMVIQDITRLIVPSAQNLAIYGAKHLDILIETVNEGWNNSIAVTKTRPQPDYAVGFSRSAFTEEQLKRLGPFVGELTDTSYFMATWYMYFPFLTCEVKCGATGLVIADRQNAHSMTLAVRAVVELYRLAKREKELDREILAFSISHDDRVVRIYGHYPVINGKDVKYYRHPIREFCFTELDGKEKWTAYKFTKNVYDNWVPDHLKRICSAVDAIPLNINFDLSQSASSPQGPQTQASRQSFSSVAMLDEDNSQPSPAVPQDITPNTSFTDQPFKRPRNKRAAE